MVEVSQGPMHIWDVLVILNKLEKEMENLKIVDNKEIMKKQIEARDDFANVLEGIIARWAHHTNTELAKIKELKVVRYSSANLDVLEDPNKFSCRFWIAYQNNRIVGYELNSNLGKFVPVRVSSTRLSISKTYLDEKKFPELNITLGGSVDKKFDNAHKIVTTIGTMFLDERIDDCLELKKELSKPNHALSIVVPKQRTKRYSLNVMQFGGLTNKIEDYVVPNNRHTVPPTVDYFTNPYRLQRPAEHGIDSQESTRQLLYWGPWHQTSSEPLSSVYSSASSLKNDKNSQSSINLAPTGQSVDEPKWEEKSRFGHDLRTQEFMALTGVINTAFIKAKELIKQNNEAPNDLNFYLTKYSRPGIYERKASLGIEFPDGSSVEIGEVGIAYNIKNSKWEFYCFNRNKNSTKLENTKIVIPKQQYHLAEVIIKASIYTLLYSSVTNYK